MAPTSAGPVRGASVKSSVGRHGSDPLPAAPTSGPPAAGAKALSKHALLEAQVTLPRTVPAGVLGLTAGVPAEGSTALKARTSPVEPAERHAVTSRAAVPFPTTVLWTIHTSTCGAVPLVLMPPPALPTTRLLRTVTRLPPTTIPADAEACTEFCSTMVRSVSAPRTAIPGPVVWVTGLPRIVPWELRRTSTAYPASPRLAGAMPSTVLSSTRKSVTAHDVPSGQPSFMAAWRKRVNVLWTTVSFATERLLARMDAPPMPSKTLSSSVTSFACQMRMASTPDWVDANLKPRMARNAASRSSRTLAVDPEYWKVAGLPFESSAALTTMGAVAVPLAVK